MPRDQREDPNTHLLSAQDANGHLRKAQEFLRTAERSLADHDRDAAGANAVPAGINAADCVSGLLQGIRWQGPHEQAARHVEKAGFEGQRLATQLRKLVRMKTQTHYETKALTAGQANGLVMAAQRAVSTAEAVAQRHS